MFMWNRFQGGSQRGSEEAALNVFLCPPLTSPSPGDPSTPVSSKPWLTRGFFGVSVRCPGGSHPSYRTGSTPHNGN